jgi:hypothetical protein
MALEEPQDWNWVASGCETMSFFVFLLYDFNAVVKMVSKFVEGSSRRNHLGHSDSRMSLYGC